MRSLIQAAGLAGTSAASRLRMMRRRRLTPLALVVLAGLLLLSRSGGSLQAQTPPNPLTVSGEGTATLPPDVARITGTVETKAEAAADALNQNSQTLNAVIASVKALGVADADIQTTGLRVDPNAQPGGTTAGYRATNGITLKTTNLNQIGDLVQAMIAAGLTNVNNVEYGLQDPEQLPILALQAAIASAQREADAIATSLGLRLGPPLNFAVQSGLSEPAPLTAPAPPPSRAGATGAPAPAVLPGPFSVTVRVMVSYTLLAP